MEYWFLLAAHVPPPRAVLVEVVVLQVVFLNFPGVQNVHQLLAQKVVQLGHIILVVLVITVQVVKLLQVLELLVHRLNARRRLLEALRREAPVKKELGRAHPTVNARLVRVKVDIAAQQKAIPQAVLRVTVRTEIA